MQYNREAAIQRLLSAYQAYYNITRNEREDDPLTAVCEFYERSGQYVLSRKAELWSANSEEFLYLYSVERLTREGFEQLRDRTREDGMKRAHIGPGHMYTYITLVIVCDSFDAEARKALKKCRIYKSFHFSLHGWMDFRAVMLAADTGETAANGSGRCVEKVMKNVLYNKKKGRKFL